MNPFVRFILILVLAGAVINLAIVLIGNNRGQARQVKIEAEEWSRIQTHYALLVENSREPRAYIFVESQQNSSDGVLDTTLLIRRPAYLKDPQGKYFTDAGGKIVSQPLPVLRITVPGSTIRLDAMAFNFRDDLPDHYRFLRNKSLLLLADIHSPVETDEKEWAHFFTLGDIPDTVRDTVGRASVTERRLWEYASDAVCAKRDNNQSELESHPGVELTTPQFAEQLLTLGALYIVPLDRDKVSILQIADPSIVSSMKNEASSPTIQFAPLKPQAL
jgi:hypothetical protein